MKKTNQQEGHSSKNIDLSTFKCTTRDEKDNLCLPKRGHVESYFFRLNSPDSERALWIKATAFVPAGRPEASVAEAWVISFLRGSGPTAAKNTISLEDAEFPKEGTADLRIDLGELSIEEGKLTGRWETDHHSISCDLKMEGYGDPIDPMELFFHKSLYKLPFPKTKLVTPAPMLTFTGEYEVDGETLEVNGWRGMGGHNWGTEHTPVYSWCQINSWENEDEAIIFEGVTARARIGQRLSPKMTILTVRAGDETISFNGPIRMFLNKGLIGPMKWSFSAGNETTGLTGEVIASPKESAGLYYRNPDGSVIHCLNSKLAHARIELRRPGKPEKILSSRQAALELGSPNEYHGVKMLV